MILVIFVMTENPGDDDIDEGTFKEQLDELLTKRKSPSEKSICAVISTFILNSLEKKTEGEPPRYLFHYLLVYLRVQLQFRESGGFDYFPLDLKKYLEEHPGIGKIQVHPKGKFRYNYDSARAHESDDKTSPIPVLEHIGVLEIKDDLNSDYQVKKVCRIVPDRIYKLKHITDSIRKNIDAFIHKSLIEWKTFEEMEELGDVQEEDSDALLQVQEPLQPVLAQTPAYQWKDRHEEFLSRIFVHQEIILDWVQAGRASLEKILGNDDVDIFDVEGLIDAAMYFKEQGFVDDVAALLDDEELVERVIRNSDFKDIFSTLKSMDDLIRKEMPNAHPFFTRLASSLGQAIVATDDLDILWQYHALNPEIATALISSLLADPGMLINNRYMLIDLLQSTSFDNQHLEKTINVVIQGMKSVLTEDFEKFDDYATIFDYIYRIVFSKLDEDARHSFLKQLLALLKEMVKQGRVIPETINRILNWLRNHPVYLEADEEAEEGDLDLDIDAAKIDELIQELIKGLADTDRPDKIYKSLDAIDSLLDFASELGLLDVLLKYDGVAEFLTIDPEANQWPFDATFSFLRTIATYFKDKFAEKDGIKRLFRLLDEHMEKVSYFWLGILRSILGPQYRPQMFYRYIKHMVQKAISPGEKEHGEIFYNHPDLCGVQNYISIIGSLNDHFDIDDDGLIKKIITLKEFPSLLHSETRPAKFLYDLEYIEYLFKEHPGLLDEDIAQWLVNHEEIRAFIEQKGLLEFDENFFDMLERFVPGSFTRLITPAVLLSSIERARKSNGERIVTLLHTFKDRYPTEFDEWASNQDIMQDVLFDSVLFFNVPNFIEKIDTIIQDAFSRFFDFDKFVNAFVHRWLGTMNHGPDDAFEMLCERARAAVNERYPENLEALETIFERASRMRKVNLHVFPKEAFDSNKRI